MLSHRGCLSVLSVTLVYCGQAAGWVKMKLVTELGLGSGHIVLDGHPALPKKGHSSQIFSPCPLWLNGWMDQDALGTEVGLGPGHIVLDGNPAAPKGAQPPTRIFYPCLLWPNGRPSQLTAEHLLILKSNFREGPSQRTPTTEIL